MPTRRSKPLIIESFRSGENTSDPPSALSDSQVVLAENVEFRRSMLGEKRRGSEALTSNPNTEDSATFMFRHTPSDDLGEAELWYLSIDEGGGTGSFVRKTSTPNSWSTLGNDDTIDITGSNRYRISAQSLHGKGFFAYKSGVDRLHVWDGSQFRRTGMAEPGAPSVADNGSGTFTGDRWYRVRFTEQDDSDASTIRRSEPSEAATITPSGSGSGIEITKPSSVSESETHWEVEASLDGTLFYVIAAVAVGTSTYIDTQDNTVGYAQDFPLSEDVGDYSLLWSPKYLTADEDRLIFAGAWEDPEKASRVGWTPVFNDPGDGNDERIPTDTTNFLDLDGQDGGEITGASQSTYGYVYIFKLGAIYKFVRTGVRSRAYEAVTITKARGALPNSVVDAVDPQGRPALFFLDPRVGPCVLGRDGVMKCGRDIEEFDWKRVNLDAEQVCHGVFVPVEGQVRWWLAVDGSETPTLEVVLQLAEMRPSETGFRGGWSHWTGPQATALCSALFSPNIDDSDPHALQLVPFVGVAGTTTDGSGNSQNVWICDRNGIDEDVGTSYLATIRTRPYMVGALVGKGSIMSGAILARAASGANVQIKLVPEFDTGDAAVVLDVDLTPDGVEDQVIRYLDNLSMGDIRSVQLEIRDDPNAPAGLWQVNLVILRVEQQDSAG